MLNRKLFHLVLMGAAMCLPRWANAQATDAASGAEPAPPQTERVSPPRTHDGLYLGLQAGPSYFSASSEADSGSREFTGPSLALRFALGGTFANRVALGAILSFEPVLSLSAQDENGEDLEAKFVLLGQGVLLDYYFLPRGGFHVLGALGFAQLSVKRSELDNDDTESPSGTFWMLGAGHEWWVGDSQSFGLLATVTDCSLEIDETGESVDVNALSFGLQLTATMN